MMTRKSLSKLQERFLTAAIADSGKVLWDVAAAPIATRLLRAGTGHGQASLSNRSGEGLLRGRLIESVKIEGTRETARVGNCWLYRVTDAGRAIVVKPPRKSIKRAAPAPWTALVPIERTTLHPQSFGIAMAQARFGGPTGAWLNCTGCARSDVIGGSKDETVVTRDTTNADCAAIFRHHGWTGEGDNMMQARCPDCVAKGAS